MAKKTNQKTALRRPIQESSAYLISNLDVQELKVENELALKLAAPARRALARLEIYRLSDFSRFRIEEISELHGMGPSAMQKIVTAMQKK